MTSQGPCVVCSGAITPATGHQGQSVVLHSYDSAGERVEFCGRECLEKWSDTQTEKFYAGLTYDKTKIGCDHHRGSPQGTYVVRADGGSHLVIANYADETLKQVRWCRNCGSLFRYEGDRVVTLHEPFMPLTLASEVLRVKEALLRSAADFDNFQKRMRREVEDAKRSAREDLLRSLLLVFDNLGRAIQSAKRSTDVKTMAEGLALVARQFVDALAQEGVSMVPTVGKAFDPAVHEAIQQLETDDHPPGIIVAEVQPGYMQGDRLMRAAMVVVAKAKSP